MLQFYFDLFDGIEQRLARRNVMGFRVYGCACERRGYFPGKWVKFGQSVDLIIEQFHTYGQSLRFGRENIDYVAPNPKCATPQLNVIPCVLQFSQSVQNRTLIRVGASTKMQDHSMIGFRISQSVDRRYGGNDNRVFAFQQRLCR